MGNAFTEVSSELLPFLSWMLTSHFLAFANLGLSVHRGFESFTTCQFLSFVTGPDQDLVYRPLTAKELIFQEAFNFPWTFHLLDLKLARHLFYSLTSWALINCQIRRNSFLALHNWFSRSLLGRADGEPGEFIIFLICSSSPGSYQRLDLFMKVLRVLCLNLTDAPENGIAIARKQMS